jgi:nucleotide-binding universal stress UspA family protein
MFEQILVPLDDAAESKAVLSYLPALVFPARSEVILAGAEPFVKTFMKRVQLPWMRSSTTPGKPSAHEDLFWTVEMLRTFGIRARAAARMNSCAEVSQQIAGALGPSLIALSRRHELGSWHFLTGSVAEQMLDTHAVSIFALNLRATDPIGSWTRGFVQRPAFKNILVPLAGSSAAMDAVRAALRFARHFHGTLLLEALEPGGLRSPGTQADLRKALALCATEAIPAVIKPRGGEASTAILEVSHESRADLIVMSSGCMAEAFSGGMGNTAARVLEEAAIPVLVVPGSTASDAIPEDLRSRA